MRGGRSQLASSAELARARLAAAPSTPSASISARAARAFSIILAARSLIAAAGPAGASLNSTDVGAAHAKRPSKSNFRVTERAVVVVVAPVFEQ